MNAFPPWLICVHSHAPRMNAHTERTLHVKKRHNNIRQHMVERQKYWDWHGMKCLYNVLFNQNSTLINCSDTTLQLTWSKHSIHTYYNMFLSCRFLGNNIASIMTFKFTWKSIGNIIYCLININILMSVWGEWWYHIPQCGIGSH